MIEFVISALLLTGAFFSLVGTIGMLRLPDVYTRSHAATKSATLGIINVLMAVFLYFLYSQRVADGRILLVIYAVFVTASVSGHMIARAAYITGLPLWEKSIKDDIALMYGEKRRKAKSQEQKPQSEA